MKITWFGHACFRIEAAGAVVLVDPFLRHNPTFGGDFDAAIAGVTHLVLTHGHMDHTGDVVEIAKSVKPTLFGSAEITDWLGRQGVDGALLQPMNTGGTVKAGAVSVTLVRADHSSAEGTQPFGNANGAILRLGEAPAVWHLGDTDIFSDMALICELHAPKVALVPVGDRFTMGGRVAAMAVRRFMPGVGHVLPCHYGTFGLLDATADAFVAGLKDWSGTVHVPQPGESVDI